MTLADKLADTASIKACVHVSFHLLSSTSQSTYMAYNYLSGHLPSNTGFGLPNLEELNLVDQSQILSAMLQN
jgi:hypothetical protein